MYSFQVLFCLIVTSTLSTGKVVLAVWKRECPSSRVDGNSRVFWQMSFFVVQYNADIQSFLNLLALSFLWRSRTWQKSTSATLLSIALNKLSSVQGLKWSHISTESHKQLSSSWKHAQFFLQPVWTISNEFSLVVRNHYDSASIFFYSEIWVWTALYCGKCHLHRVVYYVPVETGKFHMHYLKKV